MCATVSQSVYKLLQFACSGMESQLGAALIIRTNLQIILIWAFHTIIIVGPWNCQLYAASPQAWDIIT